MTGRNATRCPPLELDECLPHRPPSRLISGVIAVDGDRIVCRGTIPRGAPTADEDGASSLLAIEMGAQAAALSSALHSHARSRSRSRPRSRPLSGRREAQSEANAADSAAPNPAATSPAETDDATKPKIGYLVRIRDAKLYQQRLPVEQPLRVTVTRQGGAGELSLFEIAVTTESEPDRILAECRLATFIDSDPLATGPAVQKRQAKAVPKT